MLPNKMPKIIWNFLNLGFSLMIACFINSMHLKKRKNRLSEFSIIVFFKSNWSSLITLLIILFDWGSVLHADWTVTKHCEDGLYHVVLFWCLIRSTLMIALFIGFGCDARFCQCAPQSLNILPFSHTAENTINAQKFAQAPCSHLCDLSCESWSLKRGLN